MLQIIQDLCASNNKGVGPTFSFGLWLVQFENSNLYLTLFDINKGEIYETTNCFGHRTSKLLINKYCISK